MRIFTTILLAASSCLVSAEWMAWSGDHDLVWTPQETGASPADYGNGWTPKPTPAPGSLTEGEATLELFRRVDTSWINSKTCGWFSGPASQAWTCTNSSTCATNFNNVVACASGTYSPFFSVCLNYQAYQASACNSIGPGTGCCQNSQAPQCGTYIWTGSPPRSMYRCFSQVTIISMLDVPQSIVDASRTSKSSTSSTPSSGQLTQTSDIPTSNPSPGSGDGGNNNGGGSTNNTGAIVGGVVGGVGGIALIVGIIIFFLLRRRRKTREANAQTNNSQGAPGAMHQQPGMTPSPHMSQAGYYPQTATTFPPTSPYPGPGQQVKAYDPHAPAHYQGDYAPYPQAQYTPSNPGGLHPGVAHSQAGTSPPHSPGQTGYINSQNTGSSGTQYNPHHSYMSADFNGPAPAGHQNNPAEVGNENYQRR